jgi:hypothetical protein
MTTSAMSFALDEDSRQGPTRDQAAIHSLKRGHAARPLDLQVANGEAVKLPIGQVHPGPSPRVGRAKASHIEVLAELDGNWPPILINGDDFTIVDGYYRYLAARSLGHAYIYCHYFKGDPESAYVEAIRRNTKHGLPLTLEERKSAACRLIEGKPDWSDGRIAEICSLSPTTIGRIRNGLTCPTVAPHALDKRVGRDNRSRPRDAVEARRKIAEAIDSQPDASLRKIASLVGCSPETVRSVRSSLTEGPDMSDDSPTTELLSSINRDRVVELREWSADSALGATDDGSTFAQWFERNSIDDDWRRHVLTIPVSRIYEVADEARRRAHHWGEFADAVEARVRRLSAR